MADEKSFFFSGQAAYDSLIKHIDTSAKFSEFYSLEYSDGMQNNRTARGKINSKIVDKIVDKILIKIIVIHNK